MKFNLYTLLTFIFIISTTAVEYDISQGKSVKLSSPSGYSDERTCASDLNINTNCMATFYLDPKNVSTGVSMQMDLSNIYNVTKVIVWATNDYSSVNSGYFNIYVSKSDIVQFNNPSESGIFYQSNSLLIPKGMGFSFSQPAGMLGRYVTLRKDADHLQSELSIAEILVITDNRDFQITTLQNPWQNHDYEKPLKDYKAYRALDGDPNTCSFTAQVDEYLRNISGEWQADLGQDYDVSAVRIQNQDGENDGYTRFMIYSRDVSNGADKLCYSQNSAVDQKTLNLKCYCDQIVRGRYLRIVKGNVARIDNLLLCEVTVFVLHSASPVKLPGVVVSITTTSLTSPSTSSFTPYASSCSSSCSNTDQIIIGVVVGIAAIIIGILIGLLIGYCKFSIKQTTTTNQVNLDKTDNAIHSSSYDTTIYSSPYYEHVQ